MGFSPPADPKYILDACCGGRMFWFNKTNKNTLYSDNRTMEKGGFQNGWNPNFCIKPDLKVDFRNMPYPDNLFKMVVFDPPHLVNGSMKSVINKKYGLLNRETWQDDIRDGFNECFRVLDFFGVLIFKWNESNIKCSEIIKILPEKPLFGDFTGKTGKTIWMTFMKIPEPKIDDVAIAAIEQADAQQKEIEKLKTALQFYADGKHFLFDPMGGSAFLKDFGEVASEALRGGV